MSRFHPVRPKKHKHQQVPQPAAPAQSMPSEAQMQAVVNDRLQHTFEELYKLHHGDTIDASIKRCNTLLAVHDREAAALAEREPGGYRWAVSPSMAFRLQREIERLEARQDQLKEECWQMAKQLLAQVARQKAEEATRKQQEADSLCPPKQTPAPVADSQPIKETTSNPSKGGAAHALTTA